MSASALVQRATLRAVCTVLLPHVTEEPHISATVGRVEQLIASIEDPSDRKRLNALLSALASPVANFLLSGRAASLQSMDLATRTQVLDGWAQSRLQLRRVGFQALKRLTYVAYYCWPVEHGTHPSWQRVGYPGPLPLPAAPRPEPLPTLPIERDSELDCDVVVVGSGAGGGVVAGVLAQAGRSVIVLEKGVRTDSATMTQVEGEMLGQLYLGGGLMMTRSGSMPILAGSCVGGGTTVNYTASLPLPPETCAEWDSLAGLSLFSSSRFRDSLERVSRRLNVGTAWSNPSRRDQILEAGCRALGWHVDALPRNVSECREGVECGYCGYGCRHGAKNSTERTYLRDAVRADARLVVRCTVQKIIVTGGRATGVVGTVANSSGTSHRLIVRAKVVVVSCGAIATPALLLRSGLESPALGRGLRLHPVTAVVGTFPDRVEPWTGTLQTRYSDQFAHLDGGYGAKFETAPIHFALPASAYGWEGAASYANAVGQLAHTGVVGILLRDRDAGRVTASRSGHPRVDYEPSTYDAAHMRTALHGAAQVLAAAGATEVQTLQTPPTRIQPGRSGWFDRFVLASDARGYRHCRMSYITFHQMASAAMGTHRKTSVVQETGETHDVAGLFIADGSVFPTSSGVNPMLTIMAIADHIATGINQRW